METSEAGTQDYIGIFLITLATLMFEILLTRIFSVTMWYHFAFMAISVAMFGMTVGALVVFLLPSVFTPERAPYHMAVSSLLFSVSVALGFLVHLKTPFIFNASISGFYSITATYLSVSVPFVFSGCAVCLALTKFPGQISRLYAADLAGAALGCIAFKYTLDIMDAPSDVILVAALAGAGAFAFSFRRGFKRARRAAVLVTVFFLSLSIYNSGHILGNEPLLKIEWFKGKSLIKPFFEKWNSFSYVTVTDILYGPPAGWGMSPRYLRSANNIYQANLKIDAEASTNLTGYTGRRYEIEFLKHDMVNIAHYLRKNANVMAVGVGGGRDVLSALAFDQRSVTGVEINGNILDIVLNTYGEFTGHLDRDPRIRLVNDEARSYITRQKEKYDIIQVSMIDTWAATAAGAFVLTENSLYTMEAWKTFLERLTPEGILTFTRWYTENKPHETYRIVSLASAALMEAGISNPRDHIMVVKNVWGRGKNKAGVGTILLSPEPFTDLDIETVERVSGEMGFRLVLTPEKSYDPNFATIISEKYSRSYIDNFPLDISPPTDDRPFFFNMLRIGDVFGKLIHNDGGLEHNLKAVAVLWMLALTVVVLTLTFILLPLLLAPGGRRPDCGMPMFLFFASIGFGFILVEISQLQRLTVFLGHPAYSLSVVLFSLLVSSGLGSFSTRNMSQEGLGRYGRMRLLALVAAVVLFGSATPLIIKAFRASETIVRILVSVGILAPLGYLMGMAFPIGMRLASGRSEAATPWLWGINGATSVCGSVFAVILALHFGISTAFWAGFAFYLAALAAFSWETLRPHVMKTGTS